MKLQKLGGTQEHFLNISKSICKDNSCTRDRIIKRAQAGKRVEFLFTVSFFVFFQVSRQNVQAESILLYFLMYFLCLVFCLIHLMDLEHLDSFVLKFHESACLLQPGTSTSSKYSSEYKPKKTQETRKTQTHGYLRGKRNFILLNF